MTTLRDIFNARYINIKAFARSNGIKPTTLYSISDRKDPSHIGVDTFIRVAHGLGMTADELYDILFMEDENEK